jgi:ATP-binding cassette subfamily F protein 3
MSTTIVENLAKSYGAELILRGVSFRVEARDRIGLVGANGSGKTTLLNLIAGRLLPDQGSITFPERIRTGYLPQIADFHPSRSLYEEMLTVFEDVKGWEDELERLAMQLGAGADLLERDPQGYADILERYAELQTKVEHAGGYTIEPNVRRVLDGLGFSREQQAAPATQLSGGQQTRAALGKLLLQEPDLLLLDEPTNHLDLDAMEWLEGYLNTWHGAVIVVSHDRYFLDRVTTRTLEVFDQGVEAYPGNYSRYIQLRAERMARWAKEYDEQQEYIARTEEFIRRYRAGQRSKEARGRQTLLDRMERIQRPPQDERLKFKIGSRIMSGEIVLTTEKLVVGYPDRLAGSAGLRVAVADTIIRRGDRIGLLGPNGAGKTTLLRTLVGQLAVLEGVARLGHNVDIGYYAQTHEGLRMEKTLVDEIRQVSHLSEDGARSYLGRFLFSGDDVFKLVGSLSGGERSRVALAKLTLQGANFLVLDEPTNHLDLPARQVLEEILSQYDGTLIFVSHDRYFVDALATRLWVLEDGAVHVFDGNYTRYRLRAKLPESPVVEDASGNRAGGSRPARPGGQAVKAGSARTALDVEADIAGAETQLLEVENQLSAASAAADIARINELAGEYQRMQSLLDALYDEWQELAG